jgi:hypothetical protein
VFSWISNINFLLNLPIQVKGRSTAALVREALMLQARGSCSLLSMVNWVRFWKERWATVSVFMVEDRQLCAKSPHRGKWEKHCRFVRESVMLEKRGSSNMVSVVNSFCSLKEFCLLLTVFLHEQHHLCAESPHSSEWEKHWSSCKRRLTLQARGSCTLLSMVNCVSFWKERCLTFSVFMGDQHKLCANSRHTSDLDKNCSFLRESFDVRNKRV